MNKVLHLFAGAAISCSLVAVAISGYRGYSNTVRHFDGGELPVVQAREILCPTVVGVSAEQRLDLEKLSLYDRLAGGGSDGQSDGGAVTVRSDRVDGRGASRRGLGQIKEQAHPHHAPAQKQNPREKKQTQAGAGTGEAAAAVASGANGAGHDSAAAEDLDAQAHEEVIRRVLRERMARRQRSIFSEAGGGVEGDGE